MAKNNEENLNSFNIIAASTKIIGNISADTDMRIDGILDGNLDSSAKLVIGNKGNVTGNIKCKNAEISGNIKGKIEVSDILILHASASIEGDIITGSLAVEPGAVFNGNCNMKNHQSNDGNPKK